jgi:hypothetical protein
VTRADLRRFVELALLLVASACASLMGVVLVFVLLAFYASLFAAVILSFVWTFAAGWRFIFG